MQVTMLGHAALLCETEDVRILMDPWLVGPANFRSWWHLPDVDLDPAKLPEIDYIYISHSHSDHFHVPTLEAFHQRPTVLIPRLYHNRLVSRLRDLRYTRIKVLSLRGSRRRTQPVDQRACHAQQFRPKCADSRSEGGGPLCRRVCSPD